MLPEELESKIKSIVDELEKSEQTVRLRQLAVWRKYDMMWKGIPDSWWDAEIGDWRTAADAVVGLISEGAEFEPSEYDKTVNIYRGHGESVIAALSTALPFVHWGPEDSDNPDDIATSKAFSKIAKLVQRHNDAIILFIKTMLILWKYGVVAIYNEYSRDPKYGTFQRKDIQLRQQGMQQAVCPDCQISLGDPSQVNPTSEVEGEPPMAVPDPLSPPGEEGMPADVPPSPQMMDAPSPLMNCPNCGDVSPEMQQYSESQPYVAGTETVNKGRVLLKVFSPMNVKMPYYVTCQGDMPYITYEAEYHYTVIRALYPEKADKIAPQPAEADGTFDRWSRIRRSEFSVGESKDLVTVKRTWLRPSSYYVLGEQADVLMLQQTYPEGLCITQIPGGEVLEVYPEKMDECWTISESPLSETIHASPIGEPLISVQEMITELLALTMQTIEYGIGETWADPAVVDFQAYQETRKGPGWTFPVKARRAGEPLAQSFFQTSGPTLSKEVEPFNKRLDQYAQFSVGSYPSIYGGQLQGGSGTLGEYKESGQRALQRLSSHWKMAKVLWARTMDKSTRMFANNMEQDERYGEKFGPGSVNVWIRRADLTGQVGAAEPEASEGFPETWQEQQDKVLFLISQNNPAINQALFHSENVGRLKSLLGLPDFYVPGEKDREKQLYEISELVKSQPVMGPDAGMSMPTVDIEPLIDDDMIHIATVVAWAQSDIGQDMKATNPAGYQNVMMHLQQHQLNLQAKMAAQAEQQAAMDAQNQPGQKEGANGGPIR